MRTRKTNYENETKEKTPNEHEDKNEGENEDKDQITLCRRWSSKRY